MMSAGMAWRSVAQGPRQGERSTVIHYLLPLPDPFFSYLKEFNRRHMSLEEASISKQSKSRSIQILNSVYVRCWMIIVEEND